jgi:hypothetical protein
VPRNVRPPTAGRRSRCKAALDTATSSWLRAGKVWPPLLARPFAARCTGSNCRGRRPTSCSAADPEKREAFIAQIGSLLDDARDERHHLVYLDEAHIHQDVDPGYGWAERGKRFQLASSSPGLKAKVSFYGLYLYNEGQVRIWPYDRASGSSIDVLRRLRAKIPTGKLIVLWDGAPYHRAKVVWSAAASLDIHLLPLPG